MITETAPVEVDDPLLVRHQRDAGDSKAVKRHNIHLLVLGGVTLVFLFFFIVYFLNILQWSRAPDFGWAASNTLEGVTVLTVHGVAEESGLAVGDRITGVNGSIAEKLSELAKLVDRQPDGRNVYQVIRDGHYLEMVVPNVPLGFSHAFQQYGPTWIFSAIFFSFGAVIFFMKPGASPSWAFMLAMFFTSIYIMFMFTSRLSPAWLGHVSTLAVAFVSAPLLHFFQVFPEEKTWLRRRRSLFIGAPYAVSLGLFFIMLLSAPQYVDVPIIWKRLGNLYLLLSLAVFLGATLLSYFKTKSVIARARAKVMAIGVILGAGVPSLDFFFVAFFGFRLLPGTYLGLIFNSILPLCIGYSIVKHNLFEVDSYIKRTVGYIAMTVILASAYLGLQSSVRYLLDGAVFVEIAENIYPIIYAVFVVFLFNPVNTRIQHVIDSVFYRKEYDFKEVVGKAENRLSAVLDMNARMKHVVNIIKETLFLDGSGLMVFSTANATADTYFEISGDESQQLFVTRDIKIANDNPLAMLVAGEKKLITRFDLEEDPRYAQHREVCIEQFDRLTASIAAPLINNDEVLGILFMGDKKSGKFFTREDVDLVKSLAMQGAVAIDNAQLVEKMKKEEAVRGNLARYLSPEIVERVVSDDMEVNLGGQRKVVSVMFSDIRDFTTISESWPPDQLVTILNEYMTEMVSIVFKHRGSIDKFVGDAIVAVYGSLIELDNQAECAVKAVFEMQEKLKELNVKWQDEYGVDMKIGCGINTGEVFLGNIGSPDRMEFTVIGDTVNLASRLEGLTKYYRVGMVVGEATHASLDEILCRKLDLVQVKGKNEAVAIYEPVCELADATDAIKAELEHYNAALSSYYAQDFDRSESMFRDLLQQFPDKKLYQIYLDRLPELRNTDLGSNWNGQFTHTSK